MNNDICLAIATAFPYVLEGKGYLVTALHNLTGRNGLTKEALDARHAIAPRKLIIEYPVATGSRDNYELITWNSSELPLYEDGAPAWRIHPDFAEHVDVAVIPLDGWEEDTWLLPVNNQSLECERIGLEAGLDVFILGYPIGLVGGGRLPMWKRGSIASEPDFDIDGLPLVYVDSATRKGMSGSPVFAQRTGYWLPEGETRLGSAIIGTGREFLGVYSGRVDDDEIGAQIGRVWKEEAIVSTIRGERIGHSMF